MYKLLIIDDEARIRERLRYTIDWSKMDVKVIGEAGDGEEALTLTRSLSPDIVLTDIRMPCIDGLEYIKSLRSEANNTKVIIISGYSDFDYAQKAIKLGAFDYLLKPVEDEDLEGVVKRCIEEIDSDKKKEAMFKSADLQMKNNFTHMKEDFLINLINGDIHSDSEIEKELKYFCINNESVNIICFIVQADVAFSEFEQKWDPHLIKFIIQNIINDFAAKLGKYESFFLQTGEAVCIVYSTKTDEFFERKITSISNGIRKITKKVLGSTVTIGIGGLYYSFLNASQSFLEAKKALEYRLYFGTGKIYNINNMYSYGRSYAHKPHDLEALLNNIKTGNKEGALVNLDIIINDISKGDTSPCPIDLKLVFIDIFNAVYKTIIELNASSDHLSEFSLKFLVHLNLLQTVEEIRSWLADLIISGIDSILKFRSNKKRKVVEKALVYINKHFREAMTLNDIADKFYLNASYFCKIFKEETGESFTKYVMKLRVEAAKELMTDPTLKIYEVANMVGYDDVQYFTKMFKSVSGVTPVQYREKLT